MSQAQDYYQKRRSEFEERLSKAKGRSLLFAMLRLLAFLAAVAFGYFFYDNAIVLVPSLILCLVLFVFFIRKSAEINEEKEFCRQIVSLNEKELDYLEGKLDGLISGDEYKNPDHHFAGDIDLFGDGSLFQRLNRTPLKSAERRLVALITANDIQRIADRQLFIQELASKPEWRQEFEAYSSLIKSDVESKVVADWLENHKSFIPPFFKFIPLIWTLISVAVITLYALSIVGETILLANLIGGLMITGVYIKRINVFSAHISQVKDTLKQFSLSLKLIEDHTFKTEKGQELKSRIEQEGLAASKIFNNLGAEISSLDQRSNLLLAPILDGFGLWQIRYTYRIERWIENFESKVEDWFQVIDDFHAYNSMANFSFNHPDFVYPELVDGAVIEAFDLGHPTLDSEARVNNDVRLDQHEFFIVTGANMAGKSTFLRTIGVSIVSANSGLPVCAKTFRYSPIKLISSMRTTDSLHKNESYFYSELKRLQFVTEEIQKDKFLIILDEILKGTNSADKEEGSRKFVEKLVKSNSTGIIATHDLSLCQLAEEYEPIKNYFFEAVIAGNDLSFDYKFQKGICENMNASFLMKQMGIT